jgi:hypothetical protein
LLRLARFRWIDEERTEAKRLVELALAAGLSRERLAVEPELAALVRN